MSAKKSHPIPSTSPPPPGMEDSKRPLSPDEILVAEFEYAANSAFQANEDRSKAASFFLVSVGSLVAAIFGAQKEGLTTEVYFLLAVLFLALTFLGGLTVSQLARLRAAWLEAALTMNKIKDYYIGHFQDIQLADAFRWRTSTLPPIFKRNSVSYSTVIEVAVLSGLTLGASAVFFLLGISWTSWLTPITAATILAGMGLQLWLYKRLLPRDIEKETT
ncbi:MAG: hypothetical protein AB1750_16875 [Chloroflexota bacterium]